MNISLVIPVFNEEKNIKLLLDEVYVSGVYDLLNNITVIDDCSTDNTKLILKKIRTKYSKLNIIYNKNNKGQSHCIYYAIKSISDNIIVTIDGDLQNDPKDILGLIKIFQTKKYDLIGGIRKKRKDNFSKIIASRIANKIRKFILKDNCDDTGCSLKIFNKNFFLNIDYFNGIHRFIPALYAAQNAKCFFIKVNHRPRINGKSKYNNFNRFIWGVRDIIKVKNIINKLKSHD